MTTDYNGWTKIEAGAEGDARALAILRDLPVPKPDSFAIRKGIRNQVLRRMSRAELARYIRDFRMAEPHLRSVFSLQRRRPHVFRLRIMSHVYRITGELS